jgi:NitT/TauT family transport system ATP-binding protein
MVAGIVVPTDGLVTRFDHAVYGIDRRVAYMMARAGLLPWRTVYSNIALGLRARGIDASEIRDRVERELQRVGLYEYRDWYPGALSQGMRQRASLARTLVIKPQMLLMDEPFSALDVETKAVLQQQFIDETPSDTSVIWVTHDVNEAVALCERVIVLKSNPGEIVADIAINLPSPRVVRELRFAPDYQEICERVWRTMSTSESEAAS